MAAYVPRVRLTSLAGTWGLSQAAKPRRILIPLEAAGAPLLTSSGLVVLWLTIAVAVVANVRQLVRKPISR